MSRNRDMTGSARSFNRWCRIEAYLPTPPLSWLIVQAMMSKAR
jgi:hypothetical protein